MTRTVVKANYVRLGGAAGGSGRAKLKASASYYGHRPNEEGERHWRPAFGADREGVSKEEAREFVHEAEGGYGYRMVLSPGKDMDAEVLREWTRELMLAVEGNGGTWMGWVHDDHTSNPHAHVLAFVENRIGVDHFQWMREQGDQSVAEFVAWAEEVERDPMLDEAYTLEKARMPRRETAAGEDRHEAYSSKVGPWGRKGEEEGL